MNRPVTIFLTLDYEVFLGRNFLDDEEVLFAPTDEILDRTRALECPVTLFADVCSSWAHERAGERRYVERFGAQLRRALHLGHDVQLHLHPHWETATREGGEWVCRPMRLTLAELGLERGGEGRALVARGKDWLDALLRPEDPEYRCVAFRAGALALDPDAPLLLEALLDAGISVDTSIAKDLTMALDTVDIDYRRMPAPSTWRMSPQGGLRIAASSGVLEIPIGTFRAERAQRLKFLLGRVANARRARGAGISRAEHQSRWRNLVTLARQNARYVTSDPIFVLSCDTKGFDTQFVLDGLEQYVDAHAADEHVALSLISHPKLMFEHEIDMLERFIMGARRRFGSALQFARFRDAERLVGTVHPCAA